MTLYLVKADDQTFPIDADTAGEAIGLYRTHCVCGGKNPDPYAKATRATASNYRALQDIVKRAEEAEVELASLRSRLSDIAEEG